MAEAKKPGGMISDKEAIEEIVFILFGLALLGGITTTLLNFMDALGFEDVWRQVTAYFLEHVWPVWKIVAIILSAGAFYGIYHNLQGLAVVEDEDNKIFNPSHESSAGAHRDDKPLPQESNEKWERIIEYANSANPSDWRLAIIEADIMLEEILRAMGYVGDSIGEMLKSADKNEFATLDDAWEAHKVRNKIAHSGDGFQLNDRETKRVIALFEKVFKEFDMV